MINTKRGYNMRAFIDSLLDFNLQATWKRPAVMLLKDKDSVVDSISLLEEKAGDTHQVFFAKEIEVDSIASFFTLANGLILAGQQVTIVFDSISAITPFLTELQSWTNDRFSMTPSEVQEKGRLILLINNEQKESLPAITSSIFGLQYVAE